MANKTLNAKVKLNTRDTERSIDRLFNKINKLNNLVNGNATKANGMTKAFQRSGNAVGSMNKKLSQSGNLVSGLTKKVGRLANAYLGVMGARAALTTSDTITSAENKLNYLNGGNVKATQESMGKMYVSAQKTRMAYTDMMANVSKSMTLAGDAFQGNIDNAIRFQEIMSEAYTIGGASAAEQASSMYQLIQALGSGILQGDELRSVREGAPIAYKEIEKFAQGVYNTEESLKDLASQGKITSDIVVAAMMQAGEGIDKAFANTDTTFAQAFNNLKNIAVKAFEPVMQAMNDALNSEAGQKAIMAVAHVLVILANTILWVMDLFSKFFTWFADNWYWIQWIVYAVVIAVGVYLGIMAAKAIWAGLVSFWSFLMGLSPLYIWIVVIGLVVAALVWMANSASTVCEFIYNVCMILAQAIILLVFAIAVVATIAGINLMGTTMMIALFIVGIIALLIAVFVKFTGEVIGYALGIWEVIKAVCTWITNAWSNMCNNLAAWFWNSIADMLEGVEWLLKGINKIREALGKDAITVEGVRAKADSYKSKVTENDLDIGSAWNTGYTKGYAKGEAIQSGINSWGDKLKGLGNGLDFGNMDGLLNFGANTGLGSNYNSPSKALDLLNDPASGLGSGGSFNPDKALKGIGDTADNTGRIADSMDLTEEDLQYLRDVANMEWKREYTTANITLDVTNNNNVNSDLDVFGIAHKLTEVLYEEADYLPNGVY